MYVVNWFFNLIKKTPKSSNLGDHVYLYIIYSIYKYCKFLINTLENILFSMMVLSFKILKGTSNTSSGDLIGFLKFYLQAHVIF